MTKFIPPTTSISLTSDSSLNTDVAGLKTTMDALDLSAQNVAKSLTAAFAGAAASGKSFEQVLVGIGTKLANMTLNSAMKAGSGGLSSLLSSLLGGLSGGGGLGSIVPFADGGIVSSPTFFGAGGGLGVMGERGAEAIMPLARGPDGALGLAASGQGGGTSVIVNISTPDAESFRHSEQQVSSALARAVSRGQRGL